GWVNVGGSWYFLSGSGAMQTGTQTIEGTTYVFGPDGALQP
ncbi:MAG: N-acetylmuramoyl-L-alanine amidase family protein, partial [Pauljensenia sp.]